MDEFGAEEEEREEDWISSNRLNGLLSRAVVFSHPVQYRSNSHENHRRSFVINLSSISNNWLNFKGSVGNRLLSRHLGEPSKASDIMLLRALLCSEEHRVSIAGLQMTG